MSNEQKDELLKWLRGEARADAEHEREAHNDFEEGDAAYYQGSRDAINRTIAHIEALS